VDIELDSQGRLWAITGSYPKTTGNYNKIYREGSTQAINGPAGENAVRLDVAGNVLRVVTASGKLYSRNPSTGAWTQHTPPSPEDKFVEVDTKGGRLWGVIKRTIPAVNLGIPGVERKSISSYRLATYGGGKWNAVSDARGTRQLALVDGSKISSDGYTKTYYEAWRLNSKGLLERKYRQVGAAAGPGGWVFPGKQVEDTFLRLGIAMDSSGPHGAVTLSVLDGLKYYDGNTWFSDRTVLGLRVKMSRAAFWIIDLQGNIKVGYRRDGHVKSALTRDNGATYLFYKNGTYAKTSKDKTSGFDSGYPLNMPGGWKGIPTNWYNSIDAAVSYNGTSRKYMFSPMTNFPFNPLPGYLRMSDVTVDSGYPINMPGGWKGLPSYWVGFVDAAFYAKENNRHYFFFGDEYIRLYGTQVDSGPHKLSKFAGGTLPIAFRGGVDAATYRNGHAYLIKGDQYVRVTNGKMDAGYPKLLEGNWPK
jgi:hypothetical protein